MSNELTPMMIQYMSIKEANKDSILFFRLGDFYEMFFDDALEASRILHITLTSRGKTEDKKIPMCGVPYHAADNYIARLVKSGRKVAICEQVEDVSPEKKIVKREVVRIITPGTFIADNILESSVNQYLASISFDGDCYALAYTDISTGEFKVTSVNDKEKLASEIYKIAPSECIVPESFVKTPEYKNIKELEVGVITRLDDWFFDKSYAEKNLKEHFKVKDLAGYGINEQDNVIGAAGALIKYLRDTQKNDLTNITSISYYKLENHMTLDWNSHRNLELVHSMEDFSRKGTLLEVMDRTKTPMGKRLLRKWILNPLVEVEAIHLRLNTVEYFNDNTSLRKTIREYLDDIYDVDRLSNKVCIGSSNARDVRALWASLKSIESLKKNIPEKLPEKLSDIKNKIGDFDDVINMIDKCLIEEPPLMIKDGGIIKDGYDKELDELRKIAKGGKDWLLELQKKEIERTGINSLKVGYNRVFGYYIEVTKTNMNLVPDNYIRKQTLTSGERFITEELKEYESKIIGALDNIKKIEYDLFNELRSNLSAYTENIKKTADLISELDVILSFAETASILSYVKPDVNNGSEIVIKDGRHPVLETLLKNKEFVPNDLDMNPEESRMFIITGSNMAGKSTYIRQAALITIMAQMGSFVPAGYASIGIVDRIFTRVGASDRLYRGMSTFMVEMLETANILNNATQRSLIILDEIGRGTSTYDGVSIAWSVVEYLYEHFQGAKTLFATHFHEITELADSMPGIKNFNMAIREWKDEIIFLYKVAPGSCDESFGVHVAKLAGMPKEVVSRARNILSNLQKESIRGRIKHKFEPDSLSKVESKKTEKQLDLFSIDSELYDIIDKIKNIDINNLTPIQALEKLLELKEQTKD
ncbi:MAG: DNA mismatch repair protein MutS [Candidatus Omnitrophica bacterium]|nr:DNA mismatch repair protein MutS [Candidatus Omnitrophota bacterium]